MIAAPASSLPSVAVSDRSAWVFRLSSYNHGLKHQLSDRTEALMARAKDTPLHRRTVVSAARRLHESEGGRDHIKRHCDTL